MNNYQLYKTSILLSGQMKWDIVLDITDNDIYISDFHLTPISKYIPYNRYTKDDLVKNKHYENIRDFYKKTRGSFFENYISTQLDNDWPILDDEKEYDDTFFMGCKRADFNVYGKQFEFLCPLWLEQLKDGEVLAFDINIINPSKDPSTNYKGITLATRTIAFDIGSQKYHNKFVNYFNDYINYIDVNPGSDDIININLYNGTARMKGIDLISGEKISGRDISGITSDLLSTERTLLDFNSIITTSYKSNQSIVPNIFNFNFCFNIEDIFSKGLSSKMYGKPIIVEVKSKIIRGDEVEYLEIRDLYTNFEYVPKVYCGGYWTINGSDIIPPKTDLTPNVLNYMYDYKYVNDINKAKIVQKVPYWQLNDNEEYIFNLYDGFRGFFDEITGVINGKMYITEFPINSKIWDVDDEKGEVYGKLLALDEDERLLECYNRYANTPDIDHSEYSRSLNNMGWANYVNLDYNTFVSIIAYYAIAIEKGLIIELKTGWNKNLYYDCGDKKIKVVLGYIPDDESFAKIRNILDIRSSILHPMESADVYPDTIISITGINDDVIIIGSKNKDNLTFAGAKKLLKELVESYKSIIDQNYDIQSGTVIQNTYITRFKVEEKSDGNFIWNINEYGIVDDKVLSILSEVLPGADAVSLIETLLDIMNSVRPLYPVKLNSGLNIILSESPSLSSDEILYKKDKYLKLNILRYDGKIKPNIISGNLNYIYTKKKISDFKNNKLFEKYSETKFEPLFPSIGYWCYESHLINYDQVPDFVKKYTEYKWFNNNKMIYTKPELNFDILIKYNTDEDIKQAIKDYLSKIFDIEDDNTIEYVYNLYWITYNDFEYNINDKMFKYRIQLKFK